MTEHPHRPTVHTQAELERVWRHLMEPLGFGGASIWMMRIDPDRRAVPQLLEITETESAPESAQEADSFAELLGSLDATAPGGSFAFLRSRPGHGIDAGDRAWASFLYDAGRVAGVRLEVVHLATDADLVPLPLDEVGLRPTA
jgi:hypothetical protein